MMPPINVANPNNISGILINNLVKEEDITRQRSPLDSAIFAKLLCKSNVFCSLDSEQCTLFDLIVLGCYIGPCVSEYVQTTDKNVDYHVYPSGKKVIKAFTANNFASLTRTVKLLQNYPTTPSIELTGFVLPGIFKRIARTIRW